MKIKLIFSSALFGLLIAVIACNFSGESSKSGVKITPEQRAQIEQVGILHNKGLDFVINDLMNEKIRLFEESGSNPQTRSSSGGAFPETFDFEQVVRNSTENFMKTADMELEDDFFDKVMPITRISAFTRSSAEERDAEIMEVLTPFQQEYYNRIMDVVYRKGMTLELLRKEFAKLDEEIIRKAPTAEEAEQLLIATSIGVNSGEYWTENLMKWNTILNSRIVRAIDPSEDLYWEIMGGAVTRSDSVSGSGPTINLYLPHPNHNGYFIMITPEGALFLQECPAGLIYRPELCTCDWPKPDEEPSGSSNPSDLQDVVDLLAVDLAAATWGLWGGPKAALGAGLGSSACAGIYQLIKNWWF
ncbi:MAG: carbohydrate-binding module family 14 protein [Rikenellaceae bacterium]|nr:carbohydrate-binding module family 14 protein [Rikenellaceae bacterium]MCL2692166.1 carbohydrate-binding module family 14 protein [Rikenellaceae bacterium]